MNYWLVNARTRVAGFDLNFNSSFDPYIYEADPTGVIKEGIRMNKYALSQGQGLAKMNSMVIGINRTFGPKKLQGSQTTAQKLSNIKTAEAQNIVAHPNEYVDFNMPWTLTIMYSYGFNKTGLADARINQSLGFSGNVNITPKWKISATTGYDFINKGISNTSITIYRDLHCWQASFTCIPVGNNQSYFFTFNAKSTLLQDLKLNKRSPAFFGQYY